MEHRARWIEICKKTQKLMEDPDDNVPLFPLGWKPREPESKKSGKALKNLNVILCSSG